MAYWRQGCLAVDGAACDLAWVGYATAFDDPHFLLAGIARFPYPRDYARNLADVLADAEARCRDDFDDSQLSPTGKEFRATFCKNMASARAAFDDAQAHDPELAAACGRGNARACHLHGLLLTYGIGVTRDLVAGKALLGRACHDGRDDDCRYSGVSADHPSPVLRDLEAAVAATDGR